MPKTNRRDFLKTSSVLIGAASTIGLSSCSENTADDQKAVSENTKSDLLQLNLAGYQFDRVKPLIDGRVEIEGCTINFEQKGIGDLNTHVFNGPQTLDVTEIGLHPFMLAYTNNDFRKYTLLPIFPLRLFRHKSIFIRNDRGIENPEDLRGKTIGTAGYSSTSLTWLRGIFQDEYGIKPQDVNWVISNKDSSAKDTGKISNQEQVIPEGVNIHEGTPGKDESELLVSGEVDALFHAAEPKVFVERNPIVARLFPDSRSAEQDYFKKSRSFSNNACSCGKKGFVRPKPMAGKSHF